MRRIGYGSRELRDRFEPVRRGIRSRFEVDTRALAALRVALGAIILIDLLHRAQYLELFYTDEGVYPRSVYEAVGGSDWYSLHALSGDLWFQQFMFALAGLFAVALILGYRTRLVAAVSLVLLASLHARNPAVLNGGDRLLRVLLFVALWAPLGERWSIDARRRGSARSTAVGFATAALLVQPIAVFASNAALKHRGDTWYEGEALRIALANDEMTILLGDHLANYPALLEAMNWGWVGLLSGSVVFLLLTTGRLRAFFALAYVGAFAGMLVTMFVGLFPLVLTASVVPFLTPPFWDWLARRAPVDRLERWSTAVPLGPLGRPPLERRLLDRLRRSGREWAASFAVSYGRSLLTVVGLLVLVWIVLFSASHAADADLPDEIESSVPDEQRWGLYAPNPSESYSWYVVEAQLEDGSTVDAIDGGDAITDRPPDAARAHDSFRHRKFMSSVSSSGSDGVVAERYAQWACERAQANHDRRVDRVTVLQFIQPSPIDGEYEDPTRRTIIEHRCRSAGA